MNKIGLAIRELHRTENELTVKLLHVSDRHKVDHEIFYLGRDLARWSRDHVRELARIGRDYELDLDEEASSSATLMSTLRQKGAEFLGRRAEPGLLLLLDLRELYRVAAGASLDWELLGQAAQAAKHYKLLALTKRCHPETLRQVRWANAKLKESSAQILVS